MWVPKRLKMVKSPHFLFSGTEAGNRIKRRNMTILANFGTATRGNIQFK